MARAMSERELKTLIMTLCRRLELSAHHQRPGRNAAGRIFDQIEGQPGFPDLVIAGVRGRILFAELKRQTEKLNPHQVVWADRLPADLYRLWKPLDWIENRIQAELLILAGR